MNLNKKYIEQRKQHDDQKGRERQLKTKERKTVSSQSEWIKKKINTELNQKQKK